MRTEQIVNPDDILLRQVHPLHIRNGVVYEGAFKPRSIDANQLSVNIEKLIKPEDAHRHFNVVKRSQSAAVCRISVGEALSQAVNAYGNPNEPQDNDFDRSHSELDYSTATSKTKCSKALTACASKRGIIFIEPIPQEDSSSDTQEAEAQGSEPQAD